MLTKPGSPCSVQFRWKIMLIPGCSGKPFPGIIHGPSAGQKAPKLLCLKKLPNTCLPPQDWSRWKQN